MQNKIALLLRVLIVLIAVFVLWRIFSIVVVSLEAAALSIVRFWWIVLGVVFIFILFFKKKNNLSFV